MVSGKCHIRMYLEQEGLTMQQQTHVVPVLSQSSSGTVSLLELRSMCLYYFGDDTEGQSRTSSVHGFRLLRECGYKRHAHVNAHDLHMIGHLLEQTPPLLQLPRPLSASAHLP